MTLDRPIQIEVAAGELIEKITILELKAAYLTDAEKLGHVRHELQMLQQVARQAFEPSASLADLTAQLKAINAELWQIEDAIRLSEQKQDFGPQFIELARAVYHRNDRRAELKRQINALVGSRLVEEKSYTAY